MYFLPRTNKIFSWIAHQQISRLYLYSGGFLALLVFVWFFCVHSAIAKAIEHEQAKLQQLNAQKSELMRKQTAHSSLEKQVTDLEKTFALAAKASAEHSNTDPLTHIISASQACKLGLKGCAVENYTDGAWYAQTNITLSAQGTIEQLIHFLTQVHKQIPLASISHMALSHEAQGKYALRATLGVITLKNS